LGDGNGRAAFVAEGIEARNGLNDVTVGVTSAAAARIDNAGFRPGRAPSGGASAAAPAVLARADEVIE
jgi:hypothetical protein